MAKQAGLAQEFYAGGYDLSGDVGAIQECSCPRVVLEVTAINKSARERVNGLADGKIVFSPWFNDAANQEHAALKGLPTADVLVMYVDAPTVGQPAACLVAKQMSYDWRRGNDGSLAGTVEARGQGNALDWLDMLTAGIRTDTAATNGSSKDDAAATTYGIVAHLQAFAFTGTSVTVAIQESSLDGGADPWATKLSFIAVSASRQAERKTATGTVERYLRVVTTGTFTSAAFAVAYRRGTAQDDVSLA